MGVVRAGVWLGCNKGNYKVFLGKSIGLDMCRNEERRLKVQLKNEVLGKKFKNKDLLFA